MISSHKTYDYIICGAGCAGLSMAVRLCDERFSNKSILIIDKDDKDTNDRTWCFWEEKGLDSIYQSVISNRWNVLRIRDDSRDIYPSMGQLVYNRIRALDFYNLAKDKISKSANIKWLKEVVTDIVEDSEVVKITTDNDIYQSKICYNGIPQEYNRDGQDYFLYQHFLGFEINAGKSVFDPKVATLMDFTVEQKGEVRFVYVLPFSESEAMVEATVFSDNLLERSEYETMITEYLEENYGLSDYHVDVEEYGVIPMTTARHNRKETQRIINIGSNSGRIKPSSGYAFKRIQNESEEIIKSIIKGEKVSVQKDSSKFRLYDQILFNVLINDRMEGSDVFTTMFEKNPAERVLKFLDEKTNLFEDASLFLTLPTWPFLKSMILELKSRLFNK